MSHALKTYGGKLQRRHYVEMRLASCPGPYIPGWVGSIASLDGITEKNSSLPGAEL